MADFDRILEEATEEERLRLAMRSRQARILGNSRERMSLVAGEQSTLQPQEEQSADQRSTEEKQDTAEKPAEEKSEAKLRPLANRRRRVMQQKSGEAPQPVAPATPTAPATTAAADDASERTKEVVSDITSTTPAETTPAEPELPANSLLSSIPTPTVTKEEDLVARPLLRRRMVAARGVSKSDESSSASSTSGPSVVVPDELKPKFVFFTAGRALRLVLLVACTMLGALSGALGAFRTQGARDLMLQHHGHRVSRSHDAQDSPIRSHLQRYMDSMSQQSRKIGLMNDPDKHGHHAHATGEFDLPTEEQVASGTSTFAGPSTISTLSAAPAFIVAVVAWFAMQSVLKPVFDKNLPADARSPSSGGILSLATSFLGGLNAYLSAGRAILEHSAVFAFASIVGGAVAEYALHSS